MYEAAIYLTDRHARLVDKFTEAVRRELDDPAVQARIRNPSELDYCAYGGFMAENLRSVEGRVRTFDYADEFFCLLKIRTAEQQAVRAGVLLSDEELSAILSDELRNQETAEIFKANGAFVLAKLCALKPA